MSCNFIAITLVSVIFQLYLIFDIRKNSYYVSNVCCHRLSNAISSLHIKEDLSRPFDTDM